MCPGQHARRRVDADRLCRFHLLVEDLGQIAGGEIAADRLPGVTPVGEPEHAVGAVVERPLVMRALEERRVPVVAEVGRALGRLGLEDLPLGSAEIGAEDLAFL